MAIDHVVAELNRIQSAGLVAAYAIGGAVAAQAYLEPASTVDVDVFVVFAPDSGAHPLAPLAPIYADLQAHGATIEGEYVVIGGWPVQFLPPGTPLYDEAIRHARPWRVGSEVAQLMGPEYLAAIALQTGRAKDYDRVAEFIRSRKLDMDTFRDVVSRFGLTKQWDAFQPRLEGNVEL